MFEISIPQIKKCVGELEEQEKIFNNLIQQMEAVCTNFHSLAEDGADKKALYRYLGQMQEEKRDLTQLRETLAEIVHCYEETEERLANGKVLPGNRNQFGAADFSFVGQMLEELHIVFR